MTRDDILDAAAQIFRQKGYHAASMQDIAAAVSLQKASLYHHVSSKQEILLALLNRALDMLFERISAVSRQSLPPDVKLRQMMRAYLNTLTEHIDLASVLLLEHRSLDPKLHARHIPNRDRFESLWRDVIQEGTRAEMFRCPDPALTARALLGIMNWTITWYRPSGPLSIDEISDHFAALLINGLRGNRG
jgi:AcrR family transcriptional regulator